MFNETSVPYTGPTFDPNNPLGFHVGDGEDPTCPTGQIRDFDPATNQFLPGCVDDTYAAHAHAGVMPKIPDNNNTMLWVMLAAVSFIAIAFGGRR